MDRCSPVRCDRSTVFAPRSILSRAVRGRRSRELRSRSRCRRFAGSGLRVLELDLPSASSSPRMIAKWAPSFEPLELPAELAMAEVRAPRGPRSQIRGDAQPLREAAGSAPTTTATARAREARPRPRRELQRTRSGPRRTRCRASAGHQAARRGRLPAAATERRLLAATVREELERVPGVVARPRTSPGSSVTRSRAPRGAGGTPRSGRHKRRTGGR